MIIEISVALIALTLLAWMVVFSILLLKTRKTLESTRKDVHNVATEAIDLMKKLDALATDIKSKTDSLDFVFRPLKSIGKGKHRAEASETVSEIVEWVGTSLALFNKLKNAVKHREK